LASLSNGDGVETIAPRDIGNDQGALRKMFVKDTHRGKEHSIAPRLLERLVQSATSDRIKDLYLGTTEKFLVAHRFYEKNGLERIGAGSLPAAFPRMAVDTTTRFYHRALP